MAEYDGLPCGWVSAKLGDLAEYVNGRGFKTTEWETSGKPIIRIQNLTKEKSSYNYTKQEFPEKYAVKNGDLLFSWSASLGVYLWGGGDAWLNQHIFNVIPKETTSKLFVYYLLKKITSELYSKAHGSGMVHVTKGKFEDTQIQIPPLKEQHRIVAKIEELFSELDKGIENLKLAQEQLNILRQSVLKNAFEGKLTENWRQRNPDKVRLPEQLQIDIRLALETLYRRLFDKWSRGEVGAVKPKPLKPLPPLNSEELSYLPKLAYGWTWVRLGNFISSIEAGKSFRCDEREPSMHEVGVAKVSAISWGEYDESESKTCTDKNKVNDAYLIKKDDFILSRSNTIELVGACVIAKNVSKKIMLSDKTLRINFIELKPEYILEFLRSRIGRKQIMDLSTGNQDSMRNIGQERIRSIAIPVCSNDEAVEVIELSKVSIDEIERLEAVIQSSLRHAEVLRQSILQKAFSGQLVPQDPNDEPASELLARIKIEVAKSKTTKKKKAA